MNNRTIAAVIQHRDEYLVAQRPSHMPHGGLWGFPGGKVTDGETILAAATRLLDDGLGVRVTAVGWTQLSVADPGTESFVEFVRVNITGEPQCRGCVALRWLPLEDLASLMLSPPDRKFVEFLEASNSPP